MKIFVTGATGAIGRAAVPQLVAAGHEVRAVARTEGKAATVRAAGAEPVPVDLFDPDAVRDAVAGSEGIAHLATHIPAMRQAMRKSAWEDNNRLRTEATRNLVAAARAADTRLLIKESITFIYPDCGADWIDEDVPVLAAGPLVVPTLEGERIATDFTDDGHRGVVLRFGLFYGPDNRMIDQGLRMARWRASMLAGRAGAYMASIHVDDAGAAVASAIDAPAGIYNVGDDEPLTRREYLDAFSAAFELPKLRVTPGWVLKMLAGKNAGLLLASQRVANARFRTATNWSPAYRSAREGWTAVAAAEKGTTSA
ncbi:MAG: NAD-dependent epimerase/dehydratase family protein [Acidimicrobiia bacterium]